MPTGRARPGLSGHAPPGLSAVFLDRDGVINRKAREGEYVTSWQGFSFLPGALEGLVRLAEEPLKILVATNQRGIARGRLSEADLSDIHRRMLEAVTERGGRIDAIYHCPHEVGCACRKPEVGMFQAAAEDFGLALDQTAVVGDSPSDMLAATRVGALRVLIATTGSESEQASHVDHVARDLNQAVRWLLASETDATPPTGRG